MARKIFVYINVGQVELDHDPALALALAEKALALIRDRAVPDLANEINARDIMIEALGVLGGGREVQALALARENLELSRKLLGEDHPDYGIAINIVAHALKRNNDLDGALVYRRQALDVMRRSLPAEHSTVVKQRSTVASD